MPKFKLTSNKLPTLLLISAVLSACGGGGSGSGSDSDVTALTVNNVTPSNGAVDVSRTAPISATFNEDVFVVSLGHASFSLSNSSGTEPATISFNTSNSVSLQAISTLSNLSRYTATLTTGVTDLAGNALNETYSWSFTTEDASWSTENVVAVESAAGTADFPQIALDNSGNALAVWMQDDSIWANRYSKVNGSWGTATTIEKKVDAARLPKIATDSNGNALAVWIQDSSIWANRYSVANNSWGEDAELIEQNVENATLPEIAVDGSGSALAVWTQNGGGGQSIWANRYSIIVGSWGVEKKIGLIADFARYPQVAVDGSGNPLVVWYQTDGTENSIWGNRFANGSWGGEKRIGTDNDVARPSSVDIREFIPQIAVDDSGNALTVWSQTDGTRDNIWANRYTNGSWGTAEKIETDDGDARGPQISVDSSGNALAIWYQSDGLLNTTRFNRFNVTDSSWGTAELIEADAGDAKAHQITHDNSGNALAVWQEAVSIRAIRYSAANGSWDESVLVETDAGDADLPQIAIDSSGNALVIWQQDGDIKTNKFE